MKWIRPKLILRKKAKGLNGNRGLTLIETLITLMILSVAVGSVLTTFNYCLTLSHLAEEQSVALYHAKNVMERISSTPFNTITINFPDNTADGGGANDYAAIVGGYTLDNEQIVVNYTNLLSDPLEIIVTISWMGFRERPQSMSLSTLRTE